MPLMNVKHETFFWHGPVEELTQRLSMEIGFPADIACDPRTRTLQITAFYGGQPWPEIDSALLTTRKVQIHCLVMFYDENMQPIGEAIVL